MKIIQDLAQPSTPAVETPIASMPVIETPAASIQTPIASPQQSTMNLDSLL